MIFGIPLFFILVTCCSEFDLCLLSLSSTGSTFNSSKMYSFLLWSNIVYPAVLLKNFILIDVKRFYPFFLRVQMSHPYGRTGRAIALHTFILEDFRTTCDLILFLLNTFFIFVGNLPTKTFKILDFLST